MIAKKFACAAAALGLVAAPVAAIAQPERASQPAAQNSLIGGNSVVPLALIVAMIAGGVYLVADDDDNDPVSA